MLESLFEDDVCIVSDETFVYVYVPRFVGVVPDVKDIVIVIPAIATLETV